MDDLEQKRYEQIAISKCNESNSSHTSPAAIRLTTASSNRLMRGSSGCVGIVGIGAGNGGKSGSRHEPVEGWHSH